MSYDKKTTKERIGDRSWKSPAKRLQVLVTSGLILLTMVGISIQVNNMLTSAQKPFQHVPMSEYLKTH